MSRPWHVAKFLNDAYAIKVTQFNGRCITYCDFYTCGLQTNPQYLLWPFTSNGWIPLSHTVEDGLLLGWFNHGGTVQTMWHIWGGTCLPCCGRKPEGKRFQKLWYRWENDIKMDLNIMRGHGLN